MNLPAPPEFPTDDPPIGVPASLLTFGVFVVAVMVGAFYSTPHGVLLFTGCIPIVGLDMTRRWNRALRESGTHSTKQMLSIFAGAPLWGLVLLGPLLLLQTPLVTALVVGTGVAIVYLIALYTLAIWGIGRDNFRVEVRPGGGGPYAYVDELTYIYEVEAEALKKQREADQ